jgi:hypothetical protein
MRQLMSPVRLCIEPRCAVAPAQDVSSAANAVAVKSLPVVGNLARELRIKRGCLASQHDRTRGHLRGGLPPHRVTPLSPGERHLDQRTLDQREHGLAPSCDEIEHLIEFRRDAVYRRGAHARRLARTQNEVRTRGGRERVRVGPQSMAERADVATRHRCGRRMRATRGASIMRRSQATTRA